MEQSENTAGAEAIEEQTASLESLGDLLLETEPGGNSSESSQRAGDDSGESGEESGSDDAPTKFNDLAGKLGIELDDLYKLEVSQAEDGTPITVENLKDFHAKQEDVALREIEFEERKTEQEAALMRAQEEIQELLAALPEKAIAPQILEKIRAKGEARRLLENKKTLEVIPEWNDENTRTGDIEKMSNHLREYGYPVNFLESIQDHRMMKYIRDNMRRQERIKAALDKVRSGKPNPTKPTKVTGNAPKKGAQTVKRGNARNQLEAVLTSID